MTDYRLKMTTALTVLAMMAGLFVWCDDRYVIAAEQELTTKELLKAVSNNSKAIKEISTTIKLDRVNDKLFRYRLKEEKEGELTDLEAEHYLSLENTKSRLEGE